MFYFCEHDQFPLYHHDTWNFIDMELMKHINIMHDMHVTTSSHIVLGEMGFIFSLNL